MITMIYIGEILKIVMYAMFIVMFAIAAIAMIRTTINETRVESKKMEEVERLKKINDVYERHVDWDGDEQEGDKSKL